jgi:hypothetical protein
MKNRQMTFLFENKFKQVYMNIILISMENWMKNQSTSLRCKASEDLVFKYLF